MKWVFSLGSPQELGFLEEQGSGRNSLSYPNDSRASSRDSKCSVSTDLTQTKAFPRPPTPVGSQTGVEFSVIRVLWSTFRFSDLLEGLTELRKPATLRVMVCNTEGTQIKISKGKRGAGQTSGETGHELPVVLSQWSHTDGT